MPDTPVTHRPPRWEVSDRIGLDIASVDDVHAAVQRWGDRYLKRVYTPAELADCRRGDCTAAERLAARFAAKEAVMKTLRPRSDEPLPWTSIAIDHDAVGAPVVRLSGPAAQLAGRVGVRHISISLTHEGAVAAAIALTSINHPEDEAA